MNAPHTHRKAHFETPVLLYTFPPVFLKHFPVASFDGIIIFGIRIPLALRPWTPLILIAAQQHITVGGSYNNAHLLGQCAVLRITVEIIDMHRRPDVIRLQTEKQLKDMLVSNRSDGTIRRVEPRPIVQFLFIIQKNTSVLHRWPIRFGEIDRHTKRITRFNRNIRPVMPRGYTHCLTQIINSEDRAPAVCSDNVEHTVHSFL
ncbi:hypothetical protein D3C81_1426390 [compost metagenome]